MAILILVSLFIISAICLIFSLGVIQSTENKGYVPHYAKRMMPIYGFSMILSAFFLVGTIEFNSLVI